MGPLAHLSAVDTSLTHDLSPIDRDNDRVSVSNDELLRVIRLWTEQAKDSTTNPYESLFPYVHPLVIGAVDRSSALSTRICEEILSYHMDDKERAREISNNLNSGYPSHNYPITLREAKRIGLNVEPMDDNVNALLFELNEIYSEMGQSATTDYDEKNSHDNSIIKVMEASGTMIYYQLDKDWHYRSEERRWVALNEKSQMAKGGAGQGQGHDLAAARAVRSGRNIRKLRADSLRIGAFVSEVSGGLEQGFLKLSGHFRLVALGVFGDVHGRIGSAQQAVSGGAVFGVKRDANARASAQHIAFNGKWRIKAAFQPLSNFFDRGAAANHRNQSGKFVATQPCEHIAGAKLTLHPH